MSRFDEEPDGDQHGECAAEIHKLQGNVTRLTYEMQQLLCSMSNLLHHFTRSPTNLADSEARANGHAAIKRSTKVLKEISLGEQRL